MVDQVLIKKATDSGIRKMNLLQKDPGRYMVRSILAGMYLTIVLSVFWMLANNLHESPFGKVVACLFFGVGLSAIVFTNTELFTSNNMYLSVSTMEGGTGWGDTAMLWTACYFGNLIGAIVIAGLLYGAGILTALPPDHALFVGAAHKVHQSASVIFFKGILANWVVCLAVRLALHCKEDIAKIAIMMLVVSMFLYLGAEHSIANMGTFSMALMGSGTITVWDAMYNLLYSTIGNIIGGAVVFAIPFRYINPTHEAE